MKTQETNTSARVQTFTFDNGSLSFEIDLERVAREGFEIQGDYNTEVFDSAISISLKTLIHRSTQRPSGGGDATDWLLEALQGGAAAGRFRVTPADKTRAENAMKGFKMAPEQTAAQFLANNGIEYQDDLEWLSKHYMGIRAAKAAAEKAAQSML